MRWARLALMLLAAGSLTARARAESPRWVFGGPACAESGPRFERRLAELLEQREGERLSGSVRATRGTASISVELTIEVDGRLLGSRRFETPSCARAAETAAVAAALAVYNGNDQKSLAASSGVAE